MTDPPSSFIRFYEIAKRAIEEPAQYASDGDRVLWLTPPSPKELARLAESTPEFEELALALAPSKEPQRYLVSDLLRRAIEVAEWNAHCRRLRNLARRFKPIYSDNARHRDRHGLAGTSCRSKSVADGRQTNPNAVSGKHLASFAVKSASPAAAKKPLVDRMR